MEPDKIPKDSVEEDFRKTSRAALFILLTLLVIFAVMHIVCTVTGT